MDELDRAIIDRFQGGFPVSERPFRDVARMLGTDEATLLARIERLLAERTLTRFGPLFDVERMGGEFTLAAMQVPADAFERVAAIVDGIPEVAHNYAREHPLNMWFVIATESKAATQQALERIEAETGLRVLAFPKEREYYVGLNLGTAGGRLPRASGRASGRAAPASAVDARALDRRIVQQVQGGLPLVARTYDEVARHLGVAPERIRERILAMLGDGRIRRIGAVPNHYALGWRANGMSVFDVDDVRVDELGARVGGLADVTHCYRRPRHLPGWPYNLFAMVHGRDRAEVVAKVGGIVGVLGEASRAHDILFSTRILKKSGLRIA